VSLFDGRAPDVLVLGVGGLLGEAWMSGVLAGLEESRGWDATTCRAWVGSSAGSLVAAHLAAGRRPRRPDPGARDAHGSGPDPAPARAGRPLGAASGAASALAMASEAAGALGSVVAPLGLAAMTPAGAHARGVVLRRVPDGRRSLAGLRADVATWGASWDGLRVCAVDRDSGRRVVFGSRSAPDATVADAVTASCAIPGFFAPVSIGGRAYVDGGAWSPVNADAAPAGRGDHVLVLEPTAGLLRGALRASGAVEALALRRRGARVGLVAPDAGAAPLMRRLMDADRGGRVLAAGFRQGLALGA
jgi:NTE family protein